jgi:hypothetical protein
MNKTLFKSLAVATLLGTGSLAVVAQNNAKSAEPPAKAVETAAAPIPAVAITAASTPIELARAALAAQGGDNFKNLKSTVLRGSVDLYGPNSTQSVPGGFILVLAGDKVRLEVDARPAISFKQIYDGQRSYSSLPNVDMPPASKFGLSVLPKYDQPGYIVSALPDKKKQRGFRIVDAEGNTTDYYLDAATGRVMSFMIPYNGYNFGTEHKKFKQVDGVLVAYEFTQRLEMPQGAFFAEYKVKDAKLNQPLGDDVFQIPN